MILLLLLSYIGTQFFLSVMYFSFLIVSIELYSMHVSNYSDYFICEFIREQQIYIINSAVNL